MFFKRFKKKSKRKQNKILVDNSSEFYNSSFKKSLKGNDIEMYSINNKWKAVAAEGFFRTLKTEIHNLIYKYMTLV